tara:strand:- start:408 stop:1586 length:1179 start_codon:yes stop_codon:yes gene_type:complete
MSLRYFFAKNKNSAINYMSILALTGVIVSSTAMLVVLSGFSGLKDYSLEFISNITPDLKISSKEGKGFVYNDKMKRVLQENGLLVSKSYEDKVLMSVGNNNQIVSLKSIDKNFPKEKTESLLYEGLWPELEGGEIVVGWENAYELGVAINDNLNPITLYVPKAGKGQVFSASDILKSKKTIASGIFSINSELNNSLIFSDFNFGKELFGLKDGVVGSLDVYDQFVSKKTLALLSKGFGDGFVFENKIEQNRSLYKMLNTERAVIYLIFALIVTIALFNMFGALIMMILEKKNNLKTLIILGLTEKKMSRIFLYQGLLISVVGCLIGLLIGVVLLFLQQKFSLLMITSSLAYPVSYEVINFFIVFGTILSLGAMASFATSYYAKRHVMKTFEQ